MRKKNLAFFGSLIFFVVAAGLTLAGSTEERAGVKAAQEWLSLVDAGKYAESWNEAAQVFKGAVTSEQWVGQAGAARNPLGKVAKRSVKSKTYMKTLPGAPDGDYVVVQFETSFEKKKNAIETVTPMLDKDGRWRVSGYYIR